MILFKKYALPFWPLLLLLLIIVILNSVASLINPYIVKGFIDTAVQGGAFSQLIKAGLLFFGIAFLTQGLAIGSSYLGKKISWTATNTLRTDLVLHCLNFKMDDHHMINPGDFTERIDGDVDALSNFFSNFFIVIMNNGLLLLGILTVFFIEDWRIGIAFTIFTVAVFLIINKFRNYSTPYFLKARDIVQKTYGFCEEKLNGLDVIHKSGATNFMMTRLNWFLKNKLLMERKAWMTGTFTHTITMLTFTLGTVMALGLGTSFYLSGKLTIGSIYLIYTYSQMLRTPVEQISRQYQDLQKASASIKRITKLLRTETEENIAGHQAKSSIVLEDKPPRVTFQHVSFSYHSQQRIIKNLSFEVDSGKCIGIIGRTGSGKSTLARLLTRLYDPEEGDILLDGQSIQAHTRHSVRQHVAYVTQDVQLFNASLRENITLWNEEISDAVMMNAIKDLGLWSWYSRQSAGLDTLIQPSSLSIGEAQIIALTRAFFKNPKVLVLDEATSHLDRATEKLVLQALERLMKNRTVLIITHRLNTLQMADSLIILENGEILDSVDRSDLENNAHSRYRYFLSNSMEELLI